MFMKNLFIYLFLIACSLTSCGPGIKVTSDHDSKVDFSRYSTYAFTDESAKLPINDLDSRRLMEAIKTELAAKGFTEAKEPDLFVDLEINLKQKQSATVNNAGAYRYRYYGPTTVTVTTYTEGTLFVSLVDRQTNQLVWQGHANGTYSQEVSAEKKESRINYAVAEMFKRYPPKTSK